MTKLFEDGAPSTNFDMSEELKPKKGALYRAEDMLLTRVKILYSDYHEGDLTLICAKAINTLRSVANSLPESVEDCWVRISLVIILTEVVSYQESKADAN